MLKDIKRVIDHIQITLMHVKLRSGPWGRSQNWGYISGDFFLILIQQENTHCLKFLPTILCCLINVTTSASWHWDWELWRAEFWSNIVILPVWNAVVCSCWEKSDIKGISMFANKATLVHLHAVVFLVELPSLHLWFYKFTTFMENCFKWETTHHKTPFLVPNFLEPLFL